MVRYHGTATFLWWYHAASGTSVVRDVLRELGASLRRGCQLEWRCPLSWAFSADGVGLEAEPALSLLMPHLVGLSSSYAGSYGIQLGEPSTSGTSCRTRTSCTRSEVPVAFTPVQLWLPRRPSPLVEAGPPTRRLSFRS